MAVKYKLSARKIMQVFFTLAVSICCITAIISASNIESNTPVKDVSIQVISDKKYHKVEEEKIHKKAIEDRNIDIAHTPSEQIDIKSMEAVLAADPWVSHAQVFIDNNRVLKIIVTHRKPIARLFEQNGASCYMDNSLHTMPIDSNANFYTAVVTNVPVLGNDSLSWMVKGQIAGLVHAIQVDTFWSAQISQVIIDSDFTFELMPVLGDQRIIFGDTSRTKEKFSNLYTFYKKVLNRIGWDKYEKLDLRFKDQVVASPSLPYKGPVDKANATMNWLTAFVETEVRKDSIAATIENKGKPTEPLVTQAEPKKDTKPEVKVKEQPKVETKKATAAPIVLTSTTKAVVKEAVKKEVKKETKPIAKEHAKVKDEHKKEVKEEHKKEVKKEVKKESKVTTKEHTKAKEEPKKETKVAAKKAAIKEEPKKVKADNKAVAAKDKNKAKEAEATKTKPAAAAAKKDIKKETKPVHADEKKHVEAKKENKEKPKEKAVIKPNELGQEKN